MEDEMTALDKLRALDEAASSFLRPMAEALGVLTMLDMEGGEEMLHAVGGGMAVLARLEEALSPLPFEVQGDVKIVWESEEAMK